MSGDGMEYDWAYDGRAIGLVERLEARIQSLESQNQLLREALEELHRKTRSNPEMWDTDGICHIIDKLIASGKGEE